MNVSIIIPVWNGESVIAQCLEAVFTHSGETPLEIICVDNASSDESATIIIEQFPQVRLIQQPVNLGFAGGVNAGMTAAQGNVFVLLNQDCLPHEGWLAAITQTFTQNPQIGIAGGTIYNSDGTVNHAGAHIRHPDGYGEHATAVPSPPEPQITDYVNGAVFAIRREVWEQNGRFDDDFYPGYFEESDYCYRARNNGFQTAYVPQVKATHLFSSRAWKKDPLKHSANQHRSRYRFIIKHFNAAQLSDFFAAEADAINQTDNHISQIMGRLLAARDTLRDQAVIANARQRDLGEPVSKEHERLISVGFTRLMRLAWARAHRHTDANQQKREALRQQEYELLSKIYFRAPNDTQPEPLGKRLWRLLVKRPLSFITFRDYLLLAQLNTLHVARLDLLDQQINQRLTLLETLTDYEYR